MARISFTDGSSSVPGQADAKADQKKRKQEKASASSGVSSVPGQDSAQQGKGEDNFAPSLFGSKSGKEMDAFGPDYTRQRIRFHKNDEVNVYADEMDERMGFDSRTTKIIGMVVAMVVVFFFAATLPTQIFSFVAHPAGYSIAQFLQDWTAQLQGFVAFLTGDVTLYTTYVWQIVAALLAGAALGLSGGVYQGALKNALASPSTLGVTNGASLGLILYGLFCYTSFTGTVDEYQAYISTLDGWSYFVQQFGGFLCSLLGCCVIVAIILVIAFIAGRGHVSNVSLIIAGQVLAQTIAIVINWIQYYLVYYLGNENLEELIQNNVSSTFTGVYTPSTVAVFAIPLILCMVFVFASSNRLQLLAFSDDEARSMGIAPGRTRVLLVAVCTALTALVVSFCGMIGFVGFMCPHIARRIVGPDFRYLLPACAVCGAVLVMAVHFVSYMGIPGIATGSTGMWTSIVGCVMFVIMALRSRGNKNAEWF